MFAVEINKRFPHETATSGILGFFLEHRITPKLYDEGSYEAALLRLASEEALINGRPHEGRHLVALFKEPEPMVGNKPIWAAFSPSRKELEEAIVIYTTLASPEQLDNLGRTLKLRPTKLSA